MSRPKHTEEWLESARENFSYALEHEDIALAKDVIADTFDAGFPEAARSMNLQLRDTRINESV